MTSLSVPRNAYTDAPELHPNLILGSLQLLFWLFFHPSAWHNHVARIDPDLRPDFCLAELNWAQWRNPALRQLLIMGYVLWPLLIGLLVALALWASDTSDEIIPISVALGVAIGALGGVVLGVVLSVAFGVAASVLGGVVIGVVLGLALGPKQYAAFGVTFSVVFGTAGGLIGGVANSVARQGSAHSLARQIAGTIIGATIGGVALFVGGGVAVNVVFGTANVLAGGVLGGLALFVAFGLARGWRYGVAFGVLGGVMIVVAFSVANSAGIRADSLVFGIFFSALAVLPYVLAERIAGPLAGTLASTLGIGGGWTAFAIASTYAPFWPTWPLRFIGILSGFTLAWWRPALFYPILAVWNLLLYRADERHVGDRPGLLRWHSAFWDEHQRLPLFGLDEHLVLVMERNSVEGQAAMEYLATSRQRWAAQAAQIELDARRLERFADVTTISHAHRTLAAGELAGPASALLRSFSRVSQDVDAALRQESSYNQRLALSAVEDRLDGLLRELTRSSERYATRFRPIAAHWRQIVADQVCELAEAVEARQEIDNPYIIGVPLTEQQEIFVGRTDISARIEQLLLDRRRPPLLLYGQRRMGKTSLLNNLGRLLPSTIVPLFVDLQGPATQASDHTGFLYNIVRGMVDSAERQRNLALPSLPRETLAADPFTRFDEWLDQVEGTLAGNTALLALDEFEALDSAITKRRFDEEVVLGMLRHLIQHRPRFKVLLSGTHTLDELQRWASYLINVQVVHISYLKEAEAHQLIERPVKDFALRYEPEASQRVLDLTRGHPALVQLLCAEIVALKNEQPLAIRRSARLADVEAAVPEALSHGSFFFADIQQNQVDAAGLALLRFLAAQGEEAVVSRDVLARQFPTELDRILDLLILRELVEPADGGYRFQVELIRRWFARQVE